MSVLCGDGEVSPAGTLVGREGIRGGVNGA
jgi:hypothetical protein